MTSSALVPTSSAEDLSTEVVAVRASKNLVASMSNSPETAHAAIFTYSIKPGNDVAILDGRTIVLNAKVLKCSRLSSKPALYASNAYKTACPQEKKEWRERVDNEKSKLYEWILGNVSIDHGKAKLAGGWRTKRIHSIASSSGSVRGPMMDLHSTALYFLNKMDPSDSQKLEDNIRSLHNCTVRVGSTCSGTDIGASVFQQTFAELSKHFGVSSLSDSIAFVPFPNRREAAQLNE